MNFKENTSLNDVISKVEQIKNRSKKVHWDDKQLTLVSRRSELVTYKNVEARGEYQTARYSTSKLVNTSKGNKISVFYIPTEPPQLQPV